MRGHFPEQRLVIELTHFIHTQTQSLDRTVLSSHSSYRGLRPGSKECSEHKNDWQYLSLGDLEPNEFFS